ncbi:MAG: FIST C-terminal domain-containing protein [Planctomycetota bacterium]|nr:FIST C-terminal domain-containing protein [Planctomycetota bacterium]
MSALRFASALSTDPEARVAEQRAVQQLMAGLDGAPDLLLFFCTHHYASALEGLGGRLTGATGARESAGCTGFSIVGGDKEVEGRPSLALWGARFGNGTEVRIEHLTATASSAGEVQFSGAPPVEQPHRAGVVLLADPFTFPAHVYLPELAQDLPGVPVVGGLASGGQGPRQNLLWNGGACLDHGALAVVIEGEVALETLVSQGCRPIGAPLVVTACEGPLIRKLRGSRADKVLFDLLAEIPKRDRELFKRGAHIGLAIDATKSQFGAEDLLVRNLRGVDPNQGAIVVGDDSLRAGMSVQFMVRDAATASDELQRLLSGRAAAWSEPGGQSGALLFTCGGRGAHLFRTLNHDAGAIQQHLGPDLPLAGFFCAGEIGPVGGQPFLHGFTASVGLLRARS